MGSEMCIRDRVDILAFFYRATLEKITLSLSDRIVAVSEFVKKTYLAGYESKASVVYPGVDGDVFQLENMGDRGEIVFVGQLNMGHRWKGLEDLLKAMKILKDEGMDLLLNVVGSGELENYYKKLAQSYGISAVFHGRITTEKLVNIYNRCKCVVLPSKSKAEAFGMVLIEGAACGCGAVGSRIGGIPEVLSSLEYSYPFNPEDISGLISAIRVCMSEDIDFKHQRRSALRFNWEKTAQAVEVVMREIA